MSSSCFRPRGPLAQALPLPPRLFSSVDCRGSCRQLVLRPPVVVASSCHRCCPCLQPLSTSAGCPSGFLAQVPVVVVSSCRRRAAVACCAVVGAVVVVPAVAPPRLSAQVLVVGAFVGLVLCRCGAAVVVRSACRLSCNRRCAVVAPPCCPCGVVVVALSLRLRRIWL